MIQVFRHNPTGLLEAAGMSGVVVTAGVGKPTAAVRQTIRSGFSVSGGEKETIVARFQAFSPFSRQVG